MYCMYCTSIPWVSVVLHKVWYYTKYVLCVTCYCCVCTTRLCSSFEKDSFKCKAIIECVFVVPTINHNIPTRLLIFQYI